MNGVRQIGMTLRAMLARPLPRPSTLGTLMIAAITGSCAPMLSQSATIATPLNTAQLALPVNAITPAALIEAGIDPATVEAGAFDTAAPPALFGDQAWQANAALPIAAGPAAASLAFNAASGLGQLRALDCLAQAIYYEARSQSEDGQRAVAQVVLNRVRHPAWPNSVCGVVYQGPMRAGGGCQFTFTCDGSMRFAATGPGWLRARQLAAEALAGRVFAPVGLATFYHANYVMPAWAPRLAKTAVIGAHLFYRLPGGAGTPAAFRDRYAGVEPAVSWSSYMARQSRPAAWMPPVALGGIGPGAAGQPPVALPAWIGPPSGQQSSRPNPPSNLVAEPMPVPAPAPVLAAPAEDPRIRPEFRQSGQWREDAPAAISGR